MDFRFGLVVMLCLLGLANGVTPYFDCGSPHGHISDVAIEGCDVTPCILKKGHEYSISVAFDSDVESKNSTAVVHGILAGVPIPFNIGESDGCKSGINCPIHKKQDYSYNISLLVKKEYPSMSLTVKWELQDDDHKDLFCIEFPVKIES